jgi:hypothetical protein
MTSIELNRQRMILHIMDNLFLKLKPKMKERKNLIDDT